MSQPEKCLFALPAGDLAEILRRSEKDLLSLRGGRIFITGGTGFFGKWLVGALACADAEMELDLSLTILSRDPAGFLRKYPELVDHAVIRFQAGDIVGLRATEEKYDFILHGATDTVAVTTPAQEKEREHAIVVGIERILKLAQESEARRLLNLSSGAVYGSACGQLAGAREEDAAAAIPLTAYARGKRAAELSCAQSGIDYVTARGFAFFGPHLPLGAHYAAGNFLRDANAGGPIRIRGDGTALRSYLYPSDLVTWLLRILVEGSSGRAYNLGSDEVTSTAELARSIAAACPRSPEVIIESAPSPGLQNIYLPNIDRARAELGLEIEVKLEDAIQRSLAWLARSSPATDPRRPR